MIAAIIQARMSSTRLPGKVLMPIAGIPLIGHLIRQLKHSEAIEKIIIAISDQSFDDPLEKWASEQNLVCYRGSEENVLSRYYFAAQSYQVDPIVRITADCPLIDPVVCDRVVTELINGNVNVVRTGQSFAEGLDCEVFSFNALEVAFHQAELASEQEHVTLYFYNHPQYFQIKTI